MDNATVSGGINERKSERAVQFLEPALIEALCETYGCRPVPLGIEARGYEICGYRIQRRFVDRFVLAPFNFQPVLQEYNDEIAVSLIRRAQDAGSRATAQIRVHHPLAPDIVATHALAETAESIETLVDVSCGEKALIDRMRPRHRTKLRATFKAAQAAGLAVEEFRDETTLQDVFDVMLKAYRDKHRMMPQPITLFGRLLGLNSGSSSCSGYVARDTDTGRVAGGILILKDETQWCYGWGASDAAFAEYEIGTLLIGTAMFAAAREGVPVFSLGASPKSHETLRRYKRGWGGEEHEIRTYYFREKPQAVDLHEGYPLAKMVISRTPLGLIRAAAPIAVKWLV